MVSKRHKYCNYINQNKLSALTSNIYKDTLFILPTVWLPKRVFPPFSPYTLSFYRNSMKWSTNTLEKKNIFILHKYVFLKAPNIEYSLSHKNEKTSGNTNPSTH